MCVAERKRVVVNAPGELGRHVCAGLGLCSILPDRPPETEGIDNRLQSVPYAAGGKRKGILVAFQERTRHICFQLPAPLRRPLDSESIARVEPEIAYSKVNGPVVLRRTRLGDDLDPASARARVFGGVWIIVDSDFLNFRRAKVVVGAWQPINHNGCASRPNGRRV